MNLLFVNWHDWYHSKSGGAEVYLREIARELHKIGHQIHIVCSRTENRPDEEQIEGLHFHRIGNRYNFNLVYYFHARRLIRTINPDIIIDDQNKLPLFSVCFTFQPVICMIMHMFKKTIFKEVFFPVAMFVYFSEKLIRIVYKNCHFMVLGNSGQEDLVEMSIPSSQIVVAEPGVDHHYYQPGTSTGDYLLCLGRLKKYKSVDHILEAMAQLNQEGLCCHLKIAGTGDDDVRLKTIALNLHLENQVEFLGYVPDEQVLELYQQAYLLIQPSKKEGWGLSVIEAGACRVPTIAACVPGLRDSVRNDYTGFLYEWGNVELLKEKIKYLIQHPEIREKMAQNSIEWAARFTWIRCSRIIEQTIHQAIEHHKL